MKNEYNWLHLVFFKRFQCENRSHSYREVFGSLQKNKRNLFEYTVRVNEIENYGEPRPSQFVGFYDIIRQWSSGLFSEEKNKTINNIPFEFQGS